MTVLAIVFSLVAYVIGLFIDANIGFNPSGFLMLRVLLPMLVLGGFIMASNKNNDK